MSARALDMIVVFGAAPDRQGRASLAMQGRVETAISVLQAYPELPVLVTGGFAKKRRLGVSEAAMMADLLRDAGIAENRILQEPKARDTLESAQFCTRLLRSREFVGRLGIVSSNFHLPRCVALMAIMGWWARAVRPVGLACDPPGLRIWAWRFREIPAILWDCGWALIWRGLSRA